MENLNQKIVFYSWQSDLPIETNQKGIRSCLHGALGEINASSE
jgi:hypothetical protein